MLTTTDLRWAQATTPPTLAGQLGPASYSTRPLTPLSLLLLPFFSGQTTVESPCMAQRSLLHAVDIILHFSVKTDSSVPNGPRFSTASFFAI
ncbi:hypothetical protein KFU94_16925 [Chloroflexi bacterium TSY]|nr:hypothetical protein [Chloroflexi bacterium TSY]